MAIAAKLDNVREGLVLMLQFVCLLAGVCAVCLCVWQTQTMSVGTSPILCPSDKSGGVVVAGRQKDSFQRHSPSQLAALTPRSRPPRHQTSPIRISPRISWNSRYISVLHGNSWLMPSRFLMMDFTIKKQYEFWIISYFIKYTPDRFLWKPGKVSRAGRPSLGGFTSHRSSRVSP